MSEWVPTEFRAGHAGGEPTSALANIARNAGYARRVNARLLASSTMHWSESAHRSGVSMIGAHSQTGGIHDWMAFYRGFCVIPAGASRLVAAVILHLPTMDVIRLRPRIIADDGVYVARPSVRSVTGYEMIVSSGNLATIYVPPDHGIVKGDAIYTSDFSTNIGDAAPSIVTAEGAGYIQCALSTANGSKGDGIVYTPHEYAIDTAASDDKGKVLGPLYSTTEYTHHESGMPPTAIETSCVLGSVSSSARVMDVRVDLRSRIMIGGMGALCPHVPLGVIVWAESDDDGDYLETRLSSGEPILSSTMVAVKDAIDDAATESPITHMNVALGPDGWDGFPSVTGGVDAGLGTAEAQRYTDSTTVIDADIYLDLATAFVAGWTRVVTGGTWTVTVDVGGVTASATNVTTTSWSENILSVASVGTGWRRVQVTVTLTGGAGSISLRHFRLTEAPSPGSPADD